MGWCGWKRGILDRPIDSMGDRTERVSRLRFSPLDRAAARRSQKGVRESRGWTAASLPAGGGRAAMREVCTATMQLPPSTQQCTCSGVSGKRRRTVAGCLTDCAQARRPPNRSKSPWESLIGPAESVCDCVLCDYDGAPRTALSAGLVSSGATHRTGCAGWGRWRCGAPARLPRLCLSSGRSRLATRCREAAHLPNQPSSPLLTWAASGQPGSSHRT